MRSFHGESATPTSSLQSLVATHLIAQLDAAPLQPAPFDHLVLSDIFPPTVYSQLLALLPADAYYRELKHSDAMLPDGRSARLQFPLVPDNIARLPVLQRLFWSALTDALMSPAVTDAYKTKFRETLGHVTGKKLSAIRLRPYVTLFRDVDGYKISIHPDSPRKAMTSQFYLPSDESQRHLGTLFHSKNADGSYSEAAKIRFAPNSGYAFAVCAHSYHSVNPMQPGDKPRNSLMIIIKYDRGPLIEGFKALRTKVRGWYDRLRGVAATERGEGRYETM